MGTASLLYISNGNIPSRWAHTVQTMKMAEALSGCAAHFRLVIAGDWRSRLLDRGWFPTTDGGNAHLEAWYGLSRVPQIVRLRMAWRLPISAFDKVDWPEFNAAAVAFARRQRPDVVMTRSYDCARSCLDAGLAVIFETHSGPAHERREAVQAIASHRGLRGLITIAERLAEEYIDRGAPREKICVWPDAVDARRLEDIDDAEAVRAGLGLADHDVMVIYTGHLYRHKGVETVLEAARLMPEAQFVIVGGWPTDVQRLSSLYRDVDNVRFIGFVPNVQVPSYLAAADVCVLPNSATDDSAAWTSPLKLFEYMASGRPIVATDIPAIRSILRNDDNAALVPPDDPAALAGSLQTLLRDAGRRARLAAKAREDVRPFTWSRRAQEILQRFAPECLSARDL